MKKTLNILANIPMLILWLYYRSIKFVLLQKTPSYFEFLDNSKQTLGSVYLLIIPMFFYFIYWLCGLSFGYPWNLVAFSFIVLTSLAFIIISALNKFVKHNDFI